MMRNGKRKTQNGRAEHWPGSPFVLLCLCKLITNETRDEGKKFPTPSEALPGEQKGRAGRRPVRRDSAMKNGAGHFVSAPPRLPGAQVETSGAQDL